MTMLPNFPRGTWGRQKVEEILRYGDIHLNLDKHTVFIKNKEIVLTPMEFDLLYILIKKKGHVLNRSLLLETVWGYEYFGTTVLLMFISGESEKSWPPGRKDGTCRRDKVKVNR